MATWIRGDTRGLSGLIAPSSGSQQRLSRNDVLFREGVELRHLFFVLEGSFKLVRHSSEGKELIVDLAGSGDALGSFIEPRESTALARALENSVVFPVLTSVVRSEVERSPELAIELVRRSEKRRLAAESLAARLAFGSVTGRLSSFLLEIADPTTGFLRFPLSQGEIASRIGSSRETVCSLLNELRRAGLVEIGRSQIRVVDRNGLEGVG
jgi:CRP/FNR family transcriptional regulator